MDGQTIAKLFIRLQTIYGHKWLSMVPDEATQRVALAEWQQQLAGLSPDELQRGFDRLGRRESAWPPTVFEFRALCRPHREPYERPEFQPAALPAKPADRRAARAHVEAMKQAVARP